MPDLYAGFGADRWLYLEHIFLTFAVAGYNDFFTARPGTLRTKFYQRKGVWLITGSLSEIREFVISTLTDSTGVKELDAQLARQLYTNLISNAEYRSIFSKVRREGDNEVFTLKFK